MFSPRVGQHRTIKEMCRSSHTLHLTVFPAQQFKIDTTHTTHTLPRRPTTHANTHTHTPSYFISQRIAACRSSRAAILISQRIENCRSRRATFSGKQASDNVDNQRVATAKNDSRAQEQQRAAQVQSSNNERRSGNQIADNNRYTKYQKQKMNGKQREVRGVCCVLHVVLVVVVVFFETLVG